MLQKNLKKRTILRRLIKFLLVFDCILLIYLLIFSPGYIFLDHMVAATTSYLRHGILFIILMLSVPVILILTHFYFRYDNICEHSLKYEGLRKKLPSDWQKGELAINKNALTILSKKVDQIYIKRSDNDFLDLKVVYTDGDEEVFNFSFEDALSFVALSDYLEGYLD